MNPSSHYRKRIIRHLNKQRNRLGSKSKPVTIDVKDTKQHSEMPLHIAIETPINLTDSCSKYSYDLQSVLNTDLSTIDTTPNRIFFCHISCYTL